MKIERFQGIGALDALQEFLMTLESRQIVHIDTSNKQDIVLIFNQRSPDEIKLVCEKV